MAVAETHLRPGFAAEFKAQLMRSVSSFALRDPLLAWPGENDPILKAIRVFYLLIPKDGLAEDWSERVKVSRRQIIRSHLENICDSDSLNQNNIDSIDRWLTNIGAARNQLHLYGRQVEARFGKICYYCGKTVEDDKSVDHVFPLSRGGSDELHNYRIVHKACNSSKNNFLIGGQLVWTPPDLRATLNDVPSRLRYLVFLRDNFSCRNLSCPNGLHNDVEISLGLVHSTGICCYDNLKTICKDCGD